MVHEVGDGRQGRGAIGAQDLAELGLGAVAGQEAPGQVRVFQQREPGLEDQGLIVGIVQQQGLDLQGLRRQFGAAGPKDGAGRPRSTGPRSWVRSRAG